MATIVCRAEVSSIEGQYTNQEVTLNITACVTILTQRVHIYCHYGIRSQKTIPTMVFGANSIIVVEVYMDPLGKEALARKDFLSRTLGPGICLLAETLKGAVC